MQYFVLIFPPLLDPEVQKVWQPSCQKVFKNQALAESFCILLQHFLAINQFSGSVKEIIVVFLQNGHNIVCPFYHDIPKKQ